MNLFLVLFQKAIVVMNLGDPGRVLSLDLDLVHLPVRPNLRSDPYAIKGQRLFTLLDFFFFLFAEQ